MLNTVEQIDKIFYCFCKVMERDVDMTDFMDRLIIQKIGYLLQQTNGVNKYKFSWYLRGPISGELTKDSEDYFIEYIGSHAKLDVEDLKDIKQLNTLLDFIPHKSVAEKYLELYCYIIYLIKERNIIDADVLIETTIIARPWFVEQSIRTAVGDIIRCGYIRGVRHGRMLCSNLPNR